MTRTSDTDVSIGGRIDYAKGNNADYVISVHINSKSYDNTNPRGCMVLMSCSRYQPSGSRFASIYDKENMLANAIICNLNNIGIPIADDWNTEYTNGILQRTNTVNELYPDGSPADYYGLIYNGTYAGIPTIIIEHSFLSNENDYRTHFSTDSQLDVLPCRCTRNIRGSELTFVLGLIDNPSRTSRETGVKRSGGPLL